MSVLGKIPLISSSSTSGRAAFCSCSTISSTSWKLARC